MMEEVNKKVNEYDQALITLKKLKGIKDAMESDSRVRAYMQVVKNYQDLKNKVDKLQKAKAKASKPIAESSISLYPSNIYVYMGTYKKSAINYRGLEIDGNIYVLTNENALDASYCVYLDIAGYPNHDEVYLPIYKNKEFEQNNKVIFPTIDEPSIEKYYNEYAKIKTNFIRSRMSQNKEERLVLSPTKKDHE